MAFSRPSPPRTTSRKPPSSSNAESATICAGSHPALEVDLCGHATLASAFVILNELEPSREAVVFDTLSGELRVSRDGGPPLDGLPRAPAQAMRTPAEARRGARQSPSG